jgi:hypothetical protein
MPCATLWKKLASCNKSKGIMKHSHLIFVIIIVFGFSCERDYTGTGYSYKGYPTVYYKMDSSDLHKLESQYFDLNPYAMSGLNDFGFCGMEESDFSRIIEYPPDPQLSESQCKSVVIDFLSQNARFTGVKHPDQMNFWSIDSTNGVWDGSKFWSLRSTNQFVNGVEVYYSSIVFHLWHGKVRDCEGNWYPEIAIPDTFRIDSTTAKRQLIGRVVTYYGWSGPFHATISKSDIERSTVKIVILPVKNDNVIVLYVTWEINVPAPAYYKFFVDLMSGKIISEEPTIIF